jgi:uncharacterized protein (TIGR03437 family)
VGCNPAREIPVYNRIVRVRGAFLLSIKSLSAAACSLIIFAFPVPGQGLPLPFPTIKFLTPAMDASGHSIAFGSSVTAQGVVENTIDLYTGTAKELPNVTSVGLASDGTRVVFTEFGAAGENVGNINILNGAVQRFNVNTTACIHPFALCFNCYYQCVNAPHVTPDGRRVLYTVSQDHPFFVANLDGSGVTQLPIYSGVLAPAQQRVISSNGVVVFTSAAPSGPTFAATATDVYVVNLDGTNLRNLTNFGNHPEVFAANATISADGNTILFETNFGGSGTTPVHETQIWAAFSDGSKKWQLTSSIGGASMSPSISADGKTGACVSGTVIYLLKPLDAPPPFDRRTAVYPFAFSVPQSPVVSDDGSSVAFLLGPDSTSTGAVYQINIDGSNLRRIHAPRAVSPGGVIGAAGRGSQPSPGGLASIYGINFTDDAVGYAGGFPLTDNLAGVSVIANGVKLPLLSVSPWQVNAQIPQDFSVQNTNFQLTFTAGASTLPVAALVAAASPALFSGLVQKNGSIYYQAAALHAGTAVLADADHPAKAGEVLEMYGTGLGATNPPVPAGLPSPGNPPAIAQVTPTAQIGSVDAKVQFAGLTPGLVGVYQINAVVPIGLSAGAYTVSLKSGDTRVEGMGYINVQ